MAQKRTTSTEPAPEDRPDQDMPQPAPSGTAATTRAPSGTEPATAPGETQVADHSAYVEAAQQGYWGETPAANNAAPGMPNHGDGDLRTGTNEAGALKLGPEEVAPGEQSDRTVEVVPPSNPKGDTEPAPALDPDNAEQYGNGPDRED